MQKIPKRGTEGGWTNSIGAHEELMRMKRTMLFKRSYSLRVLYDALLLRHNFDVYERRRNFAGSPYHPIYRCNVQKNSDAKGNGEGGRVDRSPFVTHMKRWCAVVNSQLCQRCNNETRSGRRAKKAHSAKMCHRVRSPDLSLGLSIKANQKVCSVAIP